jgi:hypothetical protein
MKMIYFFQLIVNKYQILTILFIENLKFLKNKKYFKISNLILLNEIHFQKLKMNKFKKI